MDEGALVALAMGQHGLATKDQALRSGLTTSAIRVRLRRGAWQAVRPGVYRIGAVADSWEQRTLAAVLAAGDDVVASHRTAARIWGLVDRSGRTEVSVQGYRRLRLPGLAVHRTIHLPAGDATTRGGVPVTTLARTLVDLAHTQSAVVIGAWLDVAVRDHGLDLGDVAECCDRLTIPGRRVPRATMEALAVRAPGYDPGRSRLESRALAAITAGGLPQPERQHPVTRPDGSAALIDLAYPAAGVALELDGWESHGVRSAFDADRARGNDLVLLGWHLLRFTWNMTDDYLCTTIAAALASAKGQRDTAGLVTTSRATTPNDQTSAAGQRDTSGLVSTSRTTTPNDQSWGG